MCYPTVRHGVLHALVYGRGMPYALTTLSHGVVQPVAKLALAGLPWRQHVAVSVNHVFSVKRRNDAAPGDGNDALVSLEVVLVDATSRLRHSR